MQDVKNTRSRDTHKQPTINKRSKVQDKTAAEPPAPQEVIAQQHETAQMRNALCEAIEENEFLRGRVIEL
jgi:hypothetical protein